MTNATMVKEATPEQLARMIEAEVRSQAIYSDLATMSDEIQAMNEAGLETGSATDQFRAALEAMHGVVEDMRCLLLSRGIQGIADWWFYRVHLGETLVESVESIGSDDDLQRIKSLLAVEERLGAVAVELIGALNSFNGPDHTKD